MSPETPASIGHAADALHRPEKSQGRVGYKRKGYRLCLLRKEIPGHSCAGRLISLVGSHVVPD